MQMSDNPDHASAGGRFMIREANGFRLEHSASIGICGYLLLSPIDPVNRFAELSHSNLAALGKELAFATDLIRRHIMAERVYCLSFGEEISSIHFHLFPRTQSLLDDYLKFNSQRERVANGPLLFDWARRNFESDNFQNVDVLNIIERMRSE